MKSNNDTSQKLFARSLLSVLIAASLNIAYAQEDQNEPSENSTEIIEVKGFAGALSSALYDKRAAVAVQDGISADDIATLPALDLGEALQSVPGVQLDREGERRESSISLRGLPGGLVRTTADGQLIASPALTGTPQVFGEPSPFGAYDAFVFSGIRVVKTTTASDQEGAIAGVVDLELPDAFRQDSGTGSVAIGARLEDLADEIDSEFKVSYTHHIVEDVLAITGKFAYADQNFRRDTIRTTRYDDLGASRYFQNVWSDVAGVSGGHDTGFATYESWAQSNGIGAGETVEVPGELRQGSEINSGLRYSFAGNIGYRPVENVQLGATVLITENNMDDNRYEQMELRIRNNSQVSLTPVSQAINTGLSDENGSIWLVPEVQFEGSDYYYDNRQFNFLRESQALIFDGEWSVNDSLTVDGAITISQAEAERDEILISPRAQRPGGQSNGTYGAWNTGSGNIGNYAVNLFNFDQAINFDDPSLGPIWDWGYRSTVTSSGFVPTISPGSSGLLLTGAYRNLQTDHNAFELNFEKTFFNSETTIQAGFRWSEDKSDSMAQRLAGAGVDLRSGNIWTNAGKIASAANGNFFGGEAPGFADISSGWYSFDFDAINAAMLATIPDVVPNGENETDIRLPSGYVQRAGRFNTGLVYETKLETLASYIQANFEGELGDIYYRGNIGIRYVSDDQSSSAPFYRLNPNTNLQEIYSFDTGENQSDFFLPSINLAFDLTEDLVFRMAHSESMSRPNLRVASPQTQVTFGAGGDEVAIRLPGTNLEPFTADNYDLSLEWYNRDSSSISIAYFKKEINGFYRNGVLGCSLPTSELNFGGLSDASGTCVSDGNDEFGEDSINPGAEVIITQWFNSSEQIRLEGFEFSVQQDLSFLPYPWNGFGGVFNYTRVNQSADTPDVSGQDPIFIPGVSDESYNLVGYYEQDNWGIRLSYNYRDDYLVESSDTLLGLGVRTVKAVGRLDMSAYYDVTENITLSLKGYNLNEGIYEEYEDVESRVRRQDFEGRTWVLSAAMKF